MDFSMKTVPLLRWASMLVSAVRAESGLELGCGDGGMINELPLVARAGMDLWQPSLDACRQEHPTTATILGDIRELNQYFRPKSVDLVCGFDILEHLHLPDALSVMAQAEDVARKGVLWWGPLEDHPRKFDMDNPCMEHVRCIHIEEFEERDYELIVFPKYFRIPNMYVADGFLAFKDMRQYDEPAS